MNVVFQIFKHGSKIIHTSVCIKLCCKGPSTNRFRPPIADLFHEVVNPLRPSLHRRPTYESANRVLKMMC